MAFLAVGNGGFHDGDEDDRTHPDGQHRVERRHGGTVVRYRIDGHAVERDGRGKQCGHGAGVRGREFPDRIRVAVLHGVREFGVQLVEFVRGFAERTGDAVQGFADGGDALADVMRDVARLAGDAADAGHHVAGLRDEVLHGVRELVELRLDVGRVFLARGDDGFLRGGDPVEDLLAFALQVAAVGRHLLGRVGERLRQCLGVLLRGLQCGDLLVDGVEQRLFGFAVRHVFDRGTHVVEVLQIVAIGVRCAGDLVRQVFQGVRGLRRILVELVERGVDLVGDAVQ